MSKLNFKLAGKQKKLLLAATAGVLVVAIARAIVGNPGLLLADESTGALDTKAGNQIMEIFRRLSDEGMTIIMITHEPSIAACADKTYRILDGELRTQEEHHEEA